MQILDGKAVATARRGQIREQVTRFKAAKKRTPGLAVVLVGDDPASHVYVANKIKACAEVGIESFETRLPATVTAPELKMALQKLNADTQVDGILLQLPLPKHLPTDECLNWISPNKDADCLTRENLGRLWAGTPLTTPCTPAGVMAILAHYKIEVSGMNAVVVGRSNIVGKPMAQLLLEANATVTICHSKTRDLRAHTRKADLVIVAAGRPEFLEEGDFAEHAVVVDVGIHRRPTPIAGKSNLFGDVKTEKLNIKAITPVPGGVGPMTITMLLQNTLSLAEARIT